jgi:hypothetical protein
VALDTPSTIKEPAEYITPCDALQGLMYRAGFLMLTRGRLAPLMTSGNDELEGVG